MEDWWIYRGAGSTHERLARLRSHIPPWRQFTGSPEREHRPARTGPAWQETLRRGQGYIPDDAETDIVNTALYLRRPLLVTGKPGVGKSTLAFSIAADLGLGPVLRWPVTSRTSLTDGLYHYDAIGRLHDANLAALETRSTDATRTAHAPRETESTAGYVRLGPLGTALVPQEDPRVLLVDEIDKGDIDLPNDLLTVFEEGAFEVIELARAARQEPHPRVGTADSPDPTAHVDRGWVRCAAFPIIVLTSNGERDFPRPSGVAASTCRSSRRLAESSNRSSGTVWRSTRTPRAT